MPVGAGRHKESASEEAHGTSPSDGDDDAQLCVWQGLPSCADLSSDVVCVCVCVCGACAERARNLSAEQNEEQRH